MNGPPLSAAKEFIARFRLPVALSFFLLTLIWFIVTVAIPAAHQQTHGFGAYHTVAHLLAQGDISEAVYDPAVFRPLVEENTAGRASDIFNANPPTTALMLWPLAGLAIDPARAVWTALNVLLLLAGIAILVRALAPEARPEVYFFLSALGLLFQPVKQNFIFGQAYVLVFVLLALTISAFHRRRPISGSVALATALLLKTAGWYLLPLLLWTRRWRFLIGTVTASALGMLLTLPLFPPAMWVSYIQLLPTVTRSPLICVTAYQTTRSFLCHLFRPQVVWTEAQTLDLPVPATLLFVTLALLALSAVLALATRRSTAAIAASVAWGIIFAPLGEQHHHVPLLIPAVWLILIWIRGEAPHKLVQVGLFLGLAAYIIPYPIFHPRLQNGWWALLAYPRLLGAWLIFLSLVFHAWTGQPLTNRRKHAVRDTGYTRTSDR